jgi:hypothetical protein
MNGAEPRLRPEAAALAATLALLGCGAARADDAIHGRLAAQESGSFARDASLDAALGLEDRNDVAGDLRLTWEPSRGPWSLQLHYEATAAYGDSVALARAGSTALAPPPPSTWLDLEGVLVDSGRARGVQRIDRLAVTYANPDWVVRVGRQALSWGAGLVFRPLDLFDPFAPNATDTEYKPGADMVYVQRLFADGSDLQLIAVPRPPRAGAAVTADASSFAAHFHTTILGHQTTWLVARDHGDWTGAVGVSGPLGGAAWNVEVMPTAVKDGRTRVSGLVNISDAVTLLHRNATVFAEYFHNGFGVSGGAPFDVADLPADLRDRVARGQLFSLRRDYFAAGLTLEASPLLNISPTLILNLDDGSAFALLAATYSLADNLTLVAGAQAALGAAGTEFGGLPLSPANPLTVAAPSRLYLQLRRYF